MFRKIKKIVILIIFIIVFVKLFQTGFVQKTKEAYSNKRLIERIPYKEFDYGDYKTVRLLHSDTGEVEELKLDNYLYGVVSAEMPVSFESEALKAQAIVARTYTINKIMNDNKHKEQGADICDNPQCCQAWISKENRMARWDPKEADENWIKIENAVNSTIGKVILFDGEPIKSFFHSNSGGITEKALYVWGGDYNYLDSVVTSGEENYSSYESTVRVTKDELVVKMKEKYSDFEIDFKKDDWIKILELTETSR